MHVSVELVQPARDFDSLSFDFSVRVEQPDAILEIEIEGTGRDGGPVCASLLSSTEWRPVRRWSWCDCAH